MMPLMVTDIDVSHCDCQTQKDHFSCEKSCHFDCKFVVKLFSSHKMMGINIYYNI